MIVEATLRSRSGRWQIGIDGGSITAIEQSPLTGRAQIGAAGAALRQVLSHHHDAPRQVVASGRLVASSVSTTTFSPEIQGILA